MERNPIEEIMQTAMDKLRTLVDVNTVIGSPVSVSNGIVVVPLSKVSIGFVAGGGEYSGGVDNISKLGEIPFAGGSGAGLSVVPIGFLVFEKGKVKVINMEDKSAFMKLLEDVPSIIKTILDRDDK